MTGFVSARQGPLGVAASIRRTERKPDAADAARLSETDAGSLDREAAPYPLARRPRQDNSQPYQSLAGGVAPQTLLEASLISATLVIPGDSPSALLAATSAEWVPPFSSLTLRDRKV